MNPDILNELHEEFRLRLREALRICAAEGVVMAPYCGRRDCAEQARIYRRSRTLAQITAKIAQLRAAGFPELARALEAVGPQTGVVGQHATNAAPGESWHQYLVAVDCVPLVDGKAIWGANEPEWKVYGEAVRYVGLEWAGDWVSFKEYPHCQLGNNKNPLTAYGPGAISRMITAGTLSSGG